MTREPYRATILMSRNAQKLGNSNVLCHLMRNPIALKCCKTSEGLTIFHFGNDYVTGKPRVVMNELEINFLEIPFDQSFNV